MTYIVYVKKYLRHVHKVRPNKVNFLFLDLGNLSGRKRVHVSNSTEYTEARMV